MKLKIFLVFLVAMAVLFSSVADGSFSLKLEYCYNFTQASANDLDFSYVYTHMRPPFVSWKDYTDQTGDRIRRDFNENKNQS